jgi:hypothetical protein
MMGWRNKVEGLDRRAGVGLWNGEVEVRLPNYFHKGCSIVMAGWEKVSCVTCCILSMKYRCMRSIYMSELSIVKIRNT